MVPRVTSQITPMFRRALRAHSVYVDVRKKEQPRPAAPVPPDFSWCASHGAYLGVRVPVNGPFSGTGSCEKFIYPEQINTGTSFDSTFSVSMYDLFSTSPLLRG